MNWLKRLFKKWFGKDEPAEPEVAKIGTELLLDDEHRFWVIGDYKIRPELLALYGEMDACLARIFGHGSLDAGNAEFFDAKVTTQRNIALIDLQHQKDLRPEIIQTMVAWREDNVTELEKEKERLEKRLEETYRDLEVYKDLNEVHIFGRRRK